jgi:hypothetical protein
MQQVREKFLNCWYKLRAIDLVAQLQLGLVVIMLIKSGLVIC